MNFKGEDKPICRICNSSNMIILPIGKYAEFFQARVNVRKDKFLYYSKMVFKNKSFFFLIRINFYII